MYIATLPQWEACNLHVAFNTKVLRKQNYRRQMQNLRLNSEDSGPQSSLAKTDLQYKR